jgi:hypothetical protein
MYRSDIDHPESKSPGPTGAAAACPLNQILGLDDDRASVREHRLRLITRETPAPLADEKVDAETSFQLCDSLREGRGGDVQSAGSRSPAGFLGDRDEIGQLLDRDLREVEHADSFPEIVENTDVLMMRIS